VSRPRRVACVVQVARHSHLRADEIAMNSALRFCLVVVRSQNYDCNSVRSVISTGAAVSNFFMRVQVTLPKFDTTVTQKKTPHRVA
jgi:hypothetical protein